LRPPKIRWTSGAASIRHRFYLSDACWRSIIKLHHVRYFDAVARHASLHGAARSLGIAQSAISRSLRELEQHLGVTLFERGRAGATLTEAGARFWLRAKRIQEEVRRSEDDAAQDQGLQTGSIIIGMSPSAQILFIPRIMGRFRERWPLVRLTILDGLAEDFEARLLDGTLDFFIGAGGEQGLHASLSVDSVVEIGRIIVARRGSRWSEMRRLADLTGAAWVQAGFAAADTNHLETAFAANGLEAPSPVSIAPSMLTTLLLLEAGDAVALVPSTWAEQRPAADAFTRLPIEDPLGVIGLSCIRRRSLPLTPAAQYLLDLALEVDL
jgi:DNA-binding transcriptional LysR family regulator